MSKNTNSGLTLVEILIGITISAIIFILSSSVMANLFSSNTKSQNVQALEQTKNDILAQITERVQWADKVNISTNRLTADEVVFQLADDRLTRDGEPITGNNVVVESFELHDYSIVDGKVSVEITIELSHKNFSEVRDNMRFVVSQRRTVIEEES